MRLNFKVVHGVWVTTVASVGSFQFKKLKAEERKESTVPLKKSCTEEFTNKSCIIVVGSTGKFQMKKKALKTNHMRMSSFVQGTGKSSTIAKYTQQNVEVQNKFLVKMRFKI